MKRFEYIPYFQLLTPFMDQLLHQLLFRDERYVLFVSQILLSGLLYLVAILLTVVIETGLQPITSEMDGSV